MDGLHHMATSTITELDLSTCHPNSLANRINAVPGLKSSTGEFFDYFVFSVFTLFSFDIFPMLFLPL